MKGLQVVRMKQIEKYKPFAKHYGILVQSMEDTAVINWDSNKSGIATNVAHEDYSIVSPDYWDIYDGEIVIRCGGGFLKTGLKVL